VNDEWKSQGLTQLYLSLKEAKLEAVICGTNTIKSSFPKGNYTWCSLQYLLQLCKGSLCECLFIPRMKSKAVVDVRMLREGRVL